jgi:hypothetical protein
MTAAAARLRGYADRPERAGTGKSQNAGQRLDGTGKGTLLQLAIRLLAPASGMIRVPWRASC